MSQAAARGNPGFGRRSAWSLPCLLLLVAACGGAAPSAGPTPAADVTMAEWSALATPRPEPLQGATRVTVSEIEVLSADPWGLAAPLDPSLGLAELVVAGLLRRRDVQFVERRRFAEAADRERRGLPRPRGAPAAGVSPGVELILSGTWSKLGMAGAFLDLRLTDAETGDVVSTWRTATADGSDPVGVARTVVGGLLTALDGLGRRPVWSDPVAMAAPSEYRTTGVPLPAVSSFFDGLAAEERWSWTDALGGYRAAARADGFFEAEALMARAARLRLGGTLGAS